jgi:hypothetical protein
MFFFFNKKITTLVNNSVVCKHKFTIVVCIFLEMCTHFDSIIYVKTSFNRVLNKP